MADRPMADRYGSVRDPSALCHAGGCQSRILIATADRAMAQNAELLEHIGRGREQAMTMTPQDGARPCQSLWCEEGGHSFSERDPGMKVVQISGTDDSGAPVNDSRTMCGGCAPRVTVRRTRPEIPQAAPAPAPSVPAGWDAQGDAGPRL